MFIHEFRASRVFDQCIISIFDVNLEWKYKRYKFLLLKKECCIVIFKTKVGTIITKNLFCCNVENYKNSALKLFALRT